MPEKIFARMLRSVCQRQGEGQVGVPRGNRIIGQISRPAALLAPPFWVFIFLLSCSLNLVLSYPSVLFISLPHLKRDAGLRSFQLIRSKNK